MGSIFQKSLFGLVLLSASSYAVDLIVNTAGDAFSTTGGSNQGTQTTGDLRSVLNYINRQTSAGTYHIIFSLGGSNHLITPQAPLPPVNLFESHTITIDGSNTNGSSIVIQNSSSGRGLFIRQGTVSVSNMAFLSNTQNGGNGGDGYNAAGGGGMGAGGAIFVDTADVTLENVQMLNNTVRGGNGGVEADDSNEGAGGGGGLVGDGGGAQTASADFGACGGGAISNGGLGIGNNQTRIAGGGGGGAIFGANAGNAGDVGENNASDGIIGLGGGGAGGGFNILAAPDGGAATDSGGGTGGSGDGNPLGTGGGGGGGGTSGSNGASPTGGAGGRGGGGGGVGQTLASNAGGAGGSTGGGGGGGAGSAGGGDGGYGGGGGGAVGLPSSDCQGGTGGFGGGGGAGGTGNDVNSQSGGGGGMGGNGGSGGGNSLRTLTAGNNGGAGGFGGGGGGGRNGGDGDFGGGGGYVAGSGGIGAADSDSFESRPFGGGGLGAGGALFVCGGRGGSLTLKGTCQISGNSVAPGTTPIGNNGGAAGSGIFVHSTNMAFSTLTLTVEDASQNLVIADAIADDSSSSLPAGGTYTAGSNMGANVTKTGVGTLTLSGVNTYAGTTAVNEGTLALNGSVINDVTVASGATLQGTGTIGNDLTVSGKVAPGNSIGTLVISNDLTLNNSSITEIELSPSDTSLLQVAGEATLAGQLSIIPQEAFYPSSTTYTILTASGGVTDTFDSVADLTGFGLSANYLANSVQLIFTTTGITTTNLNGNRLVIANYLNNNAPTQSSGLIQLTGNTLDRALDHISPSRNSFTTFVSQNTMLLFSEMMTSHGARTRANALSFQSVTSKDLVAFNDLFLSECRDVDSDIAKLDFARWFRRKKQEDEKPSTYFKEPKKEPLQIEQPYHADFWVSGFGNLSHEKAALQNPAFSVQTGGVLTGFEWTNFDKGVLGASAGYANASIQQNGHFGHGSFQGGFLSLYGQRFFGQFFIEAALWGSYQRIVNERHIVFSAYRASAESKHNAAQIDPHLLLGYHIPIGPAVLEPFLAADWVINFEEGYQEKGADPYNMKQPGKTSSMLRPELGLQALGAIDFTRGSLFLKGNLSYVYKHLYETGEITGAFVGTPNSFVVEAIGNSQNLGKTSFEIQWEGLRGGYSSFLFIGEYGSGYRANQGVLTLGQRF